MIRAVFFDFYGVWLPDQFGQYIEESRAYGPEATRELETSLRRYYHGQIDITELAGAFRYRLNRMDIDTAQFLLSEQSISPAIVTFMRELHSHFVKLGILANLGAQEYKLLSDFNAHNQLFEVIAGPLPFGLEKPLLSNEVFARALQTIGEPPDSSLAITGNPDYQRFAASLGMVVLPFEGFPKLRQTLDERLASDLNA